MLEFLPKEVRDGLEAARKKDMTKRSRLRLRVDDEDFPILQLWDNGFALDAEFAPHLRGLVDLYEGSRHLYQCLIVASEKGEGMMKYEFKWKADVLNNVPLDFVCDDHVPVGLIENWA